MPSEEAPLTEPSPPVVSVIVVTHRSAGTIGSCLESVGQFLERIPWEVVILDNASPDRTLSVIPSDPRVAVLASRVNSGFASACNRAASRASGKNLLFLNPDARLLNFPGELLAAFDQDPSLGAIGPWVEDPNRGSLSWRRRRYEAKLPTISGEILRWSEISRFLVHPWLDLVSRLTEPPARLRVGWLTGAALLIPASAFRKIGGFDERFFLYWEDVDLGVRLVRAGYRCEIRTSWKVFHDSGYARHHANPELFVEKNRSQRFLYEKIWGRVPPAIDRVRRAAEFAKGLFGEDARRRSARIVWEEKPDPASAGRPSR